MLMTGRFPITGPSEGKLPLFKTEVIRTGAYNIAFLFGVHDELFEPSLY